MVLTANPKVKARLNHGRWIVDCPLGCNSASLVYPGKPYICGDHYPRVFSDDPGAAADEVARAYELKHVYDVVFPGDKADIERALKSRPLDLQNWFPNGHPLAIEWDLPHGQSPQGLIDEERTHYKKDLVR